MAEQEVRQYRRATRPLGINELPAAPAIVFDNLFQGGTLHTGSVERAVFFLPGELSPPIPGLGSVAAGGDRRLCGARLLKRLEISIVCRRADFGLLAAAHLLFRRAAPNITERDMRLYGQITGESASILELKREIERVARSDAKVLITGESGVGKELVAREIHARSLRASRPFVPVNCAGLPETLLESELFGHVKGSFTGAYRDKPGKLESAHDGTIFLDEVGEMSMRMQGLLLRFLETGELQKVGSDRIATTVRVRVIAATNRPLPEMIQQGLFREDLFYRLNVIHLLVPPLRQRKQDIAPMIAHFLRQYTEANRSPVEQIAPDALAALLD
jgi:transcriptional regulator with PAS, ATPase and Fis domain